MYESRPYQDRAVAQALDSLRRRTPTLVALPTGAGKTVVAGRILQSFTRPAAVVHTATLRDQIRTRLPGIQVHTIQALQRHPGRSRTLLATADCLWLDEAHHYVGSSWECVWDFLPVGCAVLGVTATPARADGRGLGERFGSLVATASYSELLARGWLVPCAVRETLGGDPAAAYLAHGRGRPGVLFAPTKAACRAADERLRASGVRAATIDDTTTDRQRRRLVAEYDAGRMDVLCSPTALAEGFDSPRAEVCALGRACLSEPLYLQSVGRVLRPHPGKRGALLLDCTGASRLHGSPTDDRTYSLTGSGVRRASAATPARPRPRREREPRPSRLAELERWLATPHLRCPPPAKPASTWQRAAGWLRALWA